MTERDAAIVGFALQGFTQLRIAERFDISRQRVAAILKQHGVVKKSSKTALNAMVSRANKDAVLKESVARETSMSVVVDDVLEQWRLQRVGGDT